MKITGNVGRVSLIAAALLSATGLSGCASWLGWGGEQEIDHQKIHLIDTWAQRSGVTVIWVNQPRRTKPVATGSTPL